MEELKAGLWGLSSYMMDKLKAGLFEVYPATWWTSWRLASLLGLKVYPATWWRSRQLASFRSIQLCDGGAGSWPLLGLSSYMMDKLKAGLFEVYLATWWRSWQLASLRSIQLHDGGLKASLVGVKSRAAWGIFVMGRLVVFGSDAKVFEGVQVKLGSTQPSTQHHFQMSKHNQTSSGIWTAHEDDDKACLTLA